MQIWAFRNGPRVMATLKKNNTGQWPIPHISETWLKKTGGSPPAPSYGPLHDAAKRDFAGGRSDTPLRWGWEYLLYTTLNLFSEAEEWKLTKSLAQPSKLCLWVIRVHFQRFISNRALAQSAPSSINCWGSKHGWVEVDGGDEEGGAAGVASLGVVSALDLRANAAAEPAIEPRGAQCCCVDPVALAGDSYAHKHPL